MKKYDNYKDSGVEWIGDVPEHWEVNKFGRAMFFQEGPGLRNWQFTESGIKVICVTNIVPPNIDFSKMAKYISTAEYESTYKHFTVNKGDIMLASSGASWGKVAEYTDDEIVILNTSTIRINEGENNKVKKDFIKWIIQSPYINESINLLLTGSCQPNFGPTHLNKLTCVYPSSIEEQTTIANYLDHKTSQIDTLISKKQQFITLLQEERIAVINQAVTKGLDPKVKMKDSGIEWLGEIPEHWQTYRIDWITNIVRGNTGFKKDELLDNGEYVALQYGKTYKVDVVDDSFNYFVNSEFYKENQIVSKGDTILISTSETIEDLGHTCYYNNENIGLLGGEQILLRPNRKVLHEKYLYQYSRQFCLGLKKYAKGLKVFRYNTNDLKQIFIAIPSIEEQIQIADFLDRETIRIESLTIKMKKEIELLKEYKTALISEVVTGKVDVRNEKLN